MAKTEFLITPVIVDGSFDPKRIATELKVNLSDVAFSAGLGKDALSRKIRITTPRTQRRLREMMEIITKLAPRFESAQVAYAWYRSQPIPSFSNQTAMQLVKAGRANEVLEFIDAIDAGVYS